MRPARTALVIAFKVVAILAYLVTGILVAMVLRVFRRLKAAQPAAVCTAQITYDSEVTYDGIVERAHRSSIWSRTAHGWIMRFHQGTPF